MWDELKALRPRADLGVRALVRGWGALFAREGLRDELLSGLVLATTILPLSIWIAAISGAPPETGIFAAVVGTLFSVFLGGTHVAVSVPGLTAAILVAGIARDHGMAAVGAVVILVGALQLLTGVLGLGRFVRLVPVSVIRGSVLGLGAFMLLLHAPAVLGARISAEVSLLERLDRMGAQLTHTDLVALSVAAGSALLALSLPLLHRRIPGPLLGALVPTVIVALLGLETPVLATDALPSFTLPALPTRDLAQLAGGALALYVASALGTLTSTAALEKLAVRPTDPDQELIGNGLAGVAAGLVGAPPPAQLIASSGVAVRLGIVNRRPALVAALAVLALGAAVWPLLSHVPVAALTGVVMATAMPLLDPRPLRDLARVSRFELAVGLVAAIGIAGLGMVEGLETALALAVVGATFRLARTRALFQKSPDESAPHQVSFSGPVTFFAALELARLQGELTRADATRGVLFDLRSVVAMDATGAEGLVAAFRAYRARGGRVALLGPSPVVRQRLVGADRTGEVAGCIATTAREVEPILEKSAMLGRSNLLAGIAHFREEMREHYDSLFDQLADGQHPHTMFITCADSRISPSLLMGAHPGDLFIVRCIGALVAPAGDAHMPQEGAAIEYGVGVLGVRHIVVCGHSKCGAISALKKAQVPEELATLTRWAKHAREITGDLAPYRDVDAATRAVTVRQLEHLMSYPLVKERIESGALAIHAWFYDLGAVELYEYDEAKKEYAMLGGDRDSLPDAGGTGASAEA